MLSSKLDFLKEAGEPGCPYRLLQAAQAADICFVDVELPYGGKIAQRLALTCKLTISALDRNLTYGIAIETKDIETSKDERSSFKRSRVLRPGAVFTLQNNSPDKKPWRLRFSTAV